MHDIQNDTVAIDVQQSKPLRNKSYDIAKGIGIILVVLGHLHIPGIHFIYLFHIPFFFALAGYLYKDKYYSSLKNILEFIQLKFKRLLIPFIFFSFLGLFLHNILVKLHLYIEGATYYSASQFPLKILNTLLLSRIEVITSPNWFLKCLFFSLLIITLISYMSAKTKNFELSRLVLILCISQIGYYCYLHDFNVWIIGTICTAVLPVYIGIILKKMNCIDNNFNRNLLFYSFLILFIFDMLLKQQIKLYFNVYYNPVLLIILTIIGFIFVLEIALYLSKFKYVTNVLSYLGRNTIPILCLHILSFKFVIYLQYLVLHEDISCLKSYPIYINNGIWWFIYLIFGIGIPLLLNNIYIKIKVSIIESMEE